MRCAGLGAEPYRHQTGVQGDRVKQKCAQLPGCGISSPGPTRWPAVAGCFCRSSPHTRAALKLWWCEPERADPRSALQAHTHCSSVLHTAWPKHSPLQSGSGCKWQRWSSTYTRQDPASHPLFLSLPLSTLCSCSLAYALRAWVLFPPSCSSRFILFIWLNQFLRWRFGCNVHKPVHTPSHAYPHYL